MSTASVRRPRPAAPGAAWSASTSSRLVVARARRVGARAPRRQGPARPRRCGSRSSRPARGPTTCSPGLMDTLKAAGISIVIAAVVRRSSSGVGRLSDHAWSAARQRHRSSSSSAPSRLLMMIFFYLGLGRPRSSSRPTCRWSPSSSGLTFYNGSVFAELVRSGVHGLPRGQREAALAIGLRDGQSLRLVEVPAGPHRDAAGDRQPARRDPQGHRARRHRHLPRAARRRPRFGSGNGNILQALVVAALIFIVINYGADQAADLLAAASASGPRASRAPRRRAWWSATGND